MTGDVIDGGFGNNPQFEEMLREVRRGILPDSPFVILYKTEVGGLLAVSPITNPDLSNFSVMLQAEAMADYLSTILSEG